MESAIEQFKYLLKLWRPLYQYAIVIYVAIKTPEPKLLYGRVIFLDWLPDNIDLFKIETEHLLADRHIVDLSTDSIDSFIENAVEGKLHMKGDRGLRLEIDGALSSFFVSPLASESMQFPSLRYFGLSKHRLLNLSNMELDSELKAAAQPFYSLDELLSALGLPSLSLMGDQTVLELVLKTPASITNESIVKSGKAVVKCHAAKDINVSHLKLGYRMLKEGFVRRGRIDASSAIWKEDKNFKEGVWEVLLEDGYSLMQTFLIYDNICIYQWWVIDPDKFFGQRRSMHQIFDKNFEFLKVILFDPDFNKQFESGVSMLFHLLGFSVVNYGRIPKVQDGPDIIALTPSQNIMVIECTTGRPNQKDKLAKLVQRTSQIRARMQLDGHGHFEIQPVLITQLSRQEIKTDLIEAGKQGVAVIAREDIEELIKILLVFPNPENLFKETKRLVPFQEEIKSRLN